MVRFLRDAFTGEKVERAYDTFEIQGFRFGIRPEQPPKIVVAALREGMLKMAGRESDGAITNWLAPDDVPQVAAALREGAGGDERELVARIFVCPSENADVVRAGARRAIAAYMNVPVYAAFQEWLGRGDELAGMWAAWKAGDRKQALAEIPDSVVDDLVVHGSPAACRQRIQAYFDDGVTTSALAILPFDPELDHWDAVTSLAPNAACTSDESGGCRSGGQPGDRRACAGSRRCDVGRGDACRHRVRNWTGTFDDGNRVSCWGTSCSFIPTS